MQIYFQDRRGTAPIDGVRDAADEDTLRCELEGMGIAVDHMEPAIDIACDALARRKSA